MRGEVLGDSFLLSTAGSSVDGGGLRLLFGISGAVKSIANNRPASSTSPPTADQAPNLAVELVVVGIQAQAAPALQAFLI